MLPGTRRSEIGKDGLFLQKGKGFGMDIIEMTRELGKLIQADKRYLEMQIARQQSDEDLELQEMIGDFNLKRMAINNEAMKEDRSEEKIKKYNEELRAVYAKIMQNAHMQAYNTAKNELDALMRHVTGLLTMIAEGADPATAEFDDSCGGDCASCAGCH